MGFRDCLAAAPAGIWQGFGDVLRHGWADAGNSYQEILTSHSAITPPAARTADYVRSFKEFDPSPRATTVEPGTVPNAPDNGPIPGLDIG